MEVVYSVLEGEERSAASTAFTRNIGVGGAFVVTDDPPPPGSMLSLEIRIPTAPAPIQIAGEVRWIADDEGDEVRGMGVKFQGLEVDQLLELNEYFSSLTSVFDQDE